MSEATVGGFTVLTDRAYDLDNHLWVEVLDTGNVRVGMDALGVETSGTLAQLSFQPADTVQRGEAIGSLEAEKFVGPLLAPISGRVVTVNEAPMADPGLVERDPYGEGWFIEIEPADLDDELGDLIVGEAEIVSRFEDKVTQYRLEGVLAE